MRLPWLIPEATRAELTVGKIELLTILPSGPLSLLPFETLVVTGEADPQYLLDVGPPIHYAPSATVLLNLQHREASTEFQRERVLTLGDPAYGEVASRVDSVDRSLGVSRPHDRARAGLQRLPYSGLEAEWFKSVFEQAGLSVVKLQAAQATEAQLRRLISGRELVHLACHGMASQEYGNFFGELAITPGASRHADDDGFLSMSEIYELDLDGCELAILSACQTNYGPQQKGEGVWALSRGFLVAGARRVVASNWVVDDRAGATLISYLANYLSRAGKEAKVQGYAASLQRAKQLIHKDQQNKKWSHPFYWSSLVLVGPN